MTDYQRKNDGGDEHSGPQHRLTLAHEQTFREWLHTGMGLVVLGFAAVGLALEPQVGRPIGAAFALLVVASGIIFMVIGRLRFVPHREQIAAKRLHPADRAISVATALALIIGLASLALVWLLRTPGP